MPANSVLDLDQPLRRRADLLTTAIADDAVTMDIASGAYFGFNKVASEVWVMLEEETSLRQICATLCERYSVSPEICEADVRLLLEKIIAEGLVTLSTKAQ